MKNYKLKGIISIITIVLIACVSTIVRADDILDLDNTLNSGNNTNKNNIVVNNTANNTANNTTGNNSTSNNTSGSNTSKNNATGNSTLKNNTTNKTNGNSSTYGESNIPYAGPEDTLLTVSVFIVCGIIGIYTFIKLSDYSNI